MAKIITGMSGGVDSAVCAYLLQAAGHEVIGVTLRTWIGSDGHDSRCCEIDDAKTEIPGEGNFVDEEGHILGTHRGIIHYTVGQRKGLKIALGHPAFVREIDAKKNEIILAEEERLYAREVLCRDVNYVGIMPMKKGERAFAFVKVRYHHEGQKAVIEALDETTVRIVFSEPVRAAAPGQSAVFYDDDDCVLGGGIIAEVC